MLDTARRRSGRRRPLLLALALAFIVLVTLNAPMGALDRPDPIGVAVDRLYAGARNRILGPPRVGLQVGHLDAASHPNELASLRTSTGASWGSLTEVDLNLAVAEALARRLETRGILVDLLPATVPPLYRADLVISIHADSSLDAHRRGYKSAVFRGERNRWDEELRRHIDAAFGAGSGLPSDDRNVSGDMLEYYAFNNRFRHSLSRSTPAVIVELGYLSHPEDRALLLQHDRVAALLEEGAVSYLAARGRLPQEDP